MDFKGKIIVLNQPTGGTSKNGNSWEKQELIIEETEGQYPQSIALEIFGEERIKKFNVQMGDIVDVKFNSKATSYNGRCYNQHQIWSLTKVGQGDGHQATASAPSNSSPTVSTKAPEQSKHNDVDDLPF